MWLTRLAVKRPAAMTMVIMFFVVLGLYAYGKIGVELYPDVNIPFVSVMIAYPGAGAEEIETQIVKPLEEAVSSLSKLKRITSVASEGRGTVGIEFDMSADTGQASLDVQKKVDEIKGLLPEDAGEPVVSRWDFNEAPVMIVALSTPLPAAETYDLAEDLIKNRLQTLPGVAQVGIIGGLQEDLIKNRLQTLPGVAQVGIIGGLQREIRVDIDRTKLAGYGLSLNQVINQLKLFNLNVPGGRLDRPEAEYNVRVMGEFRSVDEVAALEIPL